MTPNQITRRDLLISSASAMATSAIVPRALAASSQNPGSEDADRIRRMKWWHDARFGMFIHWGLYSMLGRHEWVMENEGIPVAEYEQLAQRFRPKPNAARD